MVIDSNILEDKIGELLDHFYLKRCASLDNLKLIDTLKRKNPYLYKATGVSDAGEIVDAVLKAHVSSSDETIFGNEFFEPLAKWVAERANPGCTVTTSDGEGVDITITSERSVMPIAVKSGVHVFNASSKKKQGENFSALNKRLLKLALCFDPVVGYCYGNRQQSAKSTANFRELAGQEFWEFLTGESDFYIKVIDLMGEKPIKHRHSFQISYDQAKNRFVKDFLNDFSDEKGAINWNKLLEFNSGAKKKKKSD